VKRIFLILVTVLATSLFAYSSENKQNNTNAVSSENHETQTPNIRTSRLKAIERAKTVDFSFYGIKFGFGASNLVEIVKYRKNNQSLRGDITIHVGFRYGYFKGLIGVIADIEWQRIFAQDIFNLIKLDYLSTNGIAVFNFDKHYFIGMGLYFSYLIKSRINNSSASKYFKKPDFGIILTMGGSHMFLPSGFKIFFGVEAKFGLVNVIDRPLPSSGFQNLTTFSVTISTGVGF
jgi:hypothetical protein